MEEVRPMVKVFTKAFLIDVRQEWQSNV